MFWEVLLFILIVFIGALLRVMPKALIKEEKVFPIFTIIFWVGARFYLPFAVKYSLMFLLDYQIDYWLTMGLLYVYAFLINKLG